MKLSPHFSLIEFTRSTVLNEYNKKVSDISDLVVNWPSKAERDWLQYLCINVLEPLRTMVGHPIYINSGYRCPWLNKLVGGIEDSQHLCGQAADIHIEDENDGIMIFSALRTIKYVDRALYEHKDGITWVHVSVSPNPHQYYNSQYIAQ